jgi:hypothetical protein
MSQTTKVKKALEVAAKAKITGATQTEAQGAAGAWHAVCDDPEASNDLRSVALLYRQQLEGAIVNGDASAREAALAALAGVAAKYQ